MVLDWATVILLSSGPVKPRSKDFRKPKPDAPRVLAFDIISEVNRRGGYSNLLLPQALADSNFDVRDKAFVTELVYGTIRMQGKYDYILAQISDRPWSEVDDDLVDCSRLGAHQIFSMRTPPHAAVAQTVELARSVIGESKASFLNALLRKASAKTEEEWLKPLDQITDPIEVLAIKHSHPEWIVSAYFDLLKDIALVEAELIANNVPARPTLVTWPGESQPSDFFLIGGEATKFSPYGVVTPLAPYEIDQIKLRKAGVQDEGSQVLTDIFARITSDCKSTLDLCAGPGGKAALLSHIVAASGRSFVANEISEARASLVKKVVGGAPVWVGDAREITSHHQTFDAILADVPCTGLGALRRRPEVRWRRTLQDLRSLTELQSEISEAALSILNPGGYFGYATCSPHFAETSAQVALILKKHPELEQVDITPYLSSGLVGATRGANLSLWAARHGMDSMFMAVFKKKG